MKPVAALSLFFLLFLLALTLVFHGRIPGYGVLALRYAGAAVAVLLSSGLRRHNPKSVFFTYLEVFMPLFIVLFVFDSLSHLTHYVNPIDRDGALARIDEAIFGYSPVLKLQGAIRPALTTLLQLCYTSYYFVPVVFCLILYFRNPEKEFEQAVFGIILGFFVSYVGYLLVPALGPRFYLKSLFSHDLMRGPLATAIDDTLNVLEGRNRDAFPSGHTEIVLIVLMYAWRFKRWYFWVALPPIIGLIFSTVYLRYHYAIDVIAGAALAPICFVAATLIYKAYYRRAGIATLPGER